MKKSILLVCCSLLVALIIVEAGLRLYFSVVTNYDMEMFRYARLLKKPVPTTESHVHRPSAKARLMNVELATNSHGLRDIERSYEKPRGGYRIIALGDSFTLGWGVEFEKTYAHLLESSLNSRSGQHPTLEVLNLGVGNYNTEQEFAAFREKGLPYGPDMVLLAFYINDAEPTQKHSTEGFFSASYAVAFIKQRINQLRGLLDPKFEYANYYRDLYQGENWQRYRETFKKFAQACREKNVTLRPVLLPDLRDLKNYPFREEHRKVIELMREEGLEPFDLLPEFEGRDGRKLWVAPDDPHPNAEANKIIAESIQRHFAQKGWIP